MSFRCGVYGLDIETDAPIDGALPIESSGQPDLRVHMHGVSPRSAALFETSPRFEDVNVTVFERDGAYAFRYADGTRFAIDAAAREIWCATPDTSTPEDTATYLLGPILAFAPRRRGTLSLHASAVEIGGRAVAIAAPPGGGKSTTAAAFADRGATVVTDDVLPIVWRGGAPWVLPGYPRLRLWPETAAARYGAADALPLLTPTWNKRYLDVRGNFAREAMPLGAIVVLHARVHEPTRVTPLAGHEAAIQLVANSSMALYLDAAMRAAELEAVSALADRIPIFAAHASDDLGRLDELCDAIVAVTSPS